VRSVRYRPGPATGALVLLAATAVALASAGGGAPAPAMDDPTDNSVALVEVAVRSTPDTARRVERLRGLAFRTIPHPEVVSAAELGRIERRELGRANSLEGFAADEATGRIAGLLAEDEELEAALGASEDLAAAAYDTATLPQASPRSSGAAWRRSQ